MISEVIDKRHHEKRGSEHRAGDLVEFKGIHGLRSGGPIVARKLQAFSESLASRISGRALRLFATLLAASMLDPQRASS